MNSKLPCDLTWPGQQFLIYSYSFYLLLEEKDATHVKFARSYSEIFKLSAQPGGRTERGNGEVEEHPGV